MLPVITVVVKPSSTKPICAIVEYASIRFRLLCAMAARLPRNIDAIASTIIGLGHSLGLQVIAEGVETEEQREFLARLGCDRYQGFLYSRPLPIAKLEELIDRTAGALTPEPSSVAS